MCARGPRFVNLLGHVSFARRDSDDELFYTCLEYAPRCGRRRRRDEGRNLCRARVQDDPDGSRENVQAVDGELEIPAQVIEDLLSSSSAEERCRSKTRLGWS